MASARQGRTGGPRAPRHSIAPLPPRWSCGRTGAGPPPSPAALERKRGVRGCGLPHHPSTQQVVGLCPPQQPLKRSTMPFLSPTPSPLLQAPNPLPKLPPHPRLSMQHLPPPCWGSALGQMQGPPRLPPLLGGGMGNSPARVGSVLGSEALAL